MTIGHYLDNIARRYVKGNATEQTFRGEYDPALRKARGVWYTPAPVVSFIVRAVDDILKTEFGLPMGLADTSKAKIKVNLQETDQRYKDKIKRVGMVELHTLSASF